MSPHTRVAEESSDIRRIHAIVQVIEAAVEIRRRFQFFAWTQGSFQSLVPHKVAVCGVYQRTRKEVRLEMFNSVVVPATLLAALTDGQSPFMQHVVNAWIAGRGRPLNVQLDAASMRPAQQTVDGLLEAGYRDLLVHGVSRPERANEIETLFIFSSPSKTFSSAESLSVDLLLPHLHSTYLRVQAFERETALPRTAPAAAPKGGYATAAISHREEQVLGWVREGMSNQEIGVKLGISPLTVKNHVQKILRKLSASNRAHAVARAISLNLLVPERNESEPFTARIAEPIGPAANR